MHMKRSPDEGTMRRRVGLKAADGARASDVVDKISRLRGAETAHLQDEIFLLQTLMDNVLDSIYFKDRESRFTRINRYAAVRFGIADPALAICRPDFDFFSEEHATNARQDEPKIIRIG